MLCAGEDPHKQRRRLCLLQSPEPVFGPKRRDLAINRLVHTRDVVSEASIVGEAHVGEQRLGARIGPGRTSRRGWREELEDAQRPIAHCVRVMPGVAPKEDCLTFCHTVSLARHGMGARHRPLKDDEHLVGGEDRSKLVRMTEPAPDRQTEDELVDLGRREVEPVEYLPGLLIPPRVEGDVALPNRRGLLKRWTG